MFVLNNRHVDTDGRPYNMMIGQNCDEHDGDEYFALGGGAF